MKKLCLVLLVALLFAPSAVRAHCDFDSYMAALNYARKHVAEDKKILYEGGDPLYEAIAVFSDKVEQYLLENEINYAKYMCLERKGWNELATFILEEIEPVVQAVNASTLPDNARDALIRQYLNLDNYDNGFVLSEFLVDFNNSLFSKEWYRSAKNPQAWSEFSKTFNKAVYGREVFPEYKPLPAHMIIDYPDVPL